MNSTSFESLDSQYISTLAGLGQETEAPRTSRPQALNLTSLPKSSFKAPTAEDFDKGARVLMEESPPSPGRSAFSKWFNKLSRRQVP